MLAADGYFNKFLTRNTGNMQAIKATYQNGVFTPQEPVELTDGSKVTLWFESGESTKVDHLGNEDREFLTRGGVFSDTMLDAYIELKMQEVTRFRMTTHPVEFDMYYSL